MQRNLTAKAVVIVVVVLACLFGIIGYPKFLGGVGVPTSLAQLKSNLGENIHLGLDLKGGSHLVLQVQVQDAAKTQADQDHRIDAGCDENRQHSRCRLRSERSHESRSDRLHSNQYPRRRPDKDPGLPQPGGRQVSRLDSGASERERLPDEHEAERSGRSQAQYGCTGKRYDRAPRQCARAD